MMRFTLWVLIPVLTFGLFLVPVFSQPPKSKPAEAVKLPLKKVVLFTAGIGYFHREGKVQGNAQVDLKVHADDVNDLILTLLANDPKGTSKNITYENRAPAEVTLKSFKIDLTQNPTIGQILLQVRGESVQVTDQKGKDVIGNVVSLETRSSTKDGTTTTQEILNILTEESLEKVNLSDAAKIRFAKEDLQNEFRQVLRAMADARGANTKTLNITFKGEGERNVSLGYITDAPLWKPTYRIQLGEKPQLIGLAAIENATEEDWNDVQMTLVSGRPVTFKMDLYDPLFVPRPLVEPEIYASLRPPLYQGPTQPATGGNFGLGNNFNQAQQGVGQFGNQLGIQGGIGGFGGGIGGFGGGNNSVRDWMRQGQGGAMPSQGGKPDDANKVLEQLTPATDSQARLGEAFEYQVKNPVTLPRFKSALLPILEEPIEAENLSIYNSEILAKHPMKGFRLKNNTKLFIAQGPVTIYEKGIVAGQARLPDVKPGQTQLLSYAIDLDVVMDTIPVDKVETPIEVRVMTNGTLTGRKKVEWTKRFKATNRGSEARKVWVTDVIERDWNLIAPAKAAETTANLKRFEILVPAGESTLLDIKREREEDGLADDDIRIEKVDLTPSYRGGSGVKGGKVGPGFSNQLPNQMQQKEMPPLPSPSLVVPVATSTVSLAIAEGQIVERQRKRTTVRYILTNSDSKDRVVKVEQGVIAGKTIATELKPAVVDPIYQRFDVTVPAKKSLTVDLLYDEDCTVPVALVNLSVEDLEEYRKNSSASADFKKAVGQVIASLNSQAMMAKQITEEQTALKDIEEEQKRIRSNLAVAPKESEAYKRYLKKFDDQETLIENHQAKIKELTKNVEKMKNQLNLEIQEMKVK